MSQFGKNADLAEKFWTVIAAIPNGKVASYGQIARLAGLPGYARHVGTTLKQLPADSNLPWHRVINAQGKIAFAEGSEPFLRQKALLTNEGIVFKNNKISLKEFGWP